ncbi:MAG: twitching motility protein PilT [Elusimicrobia bacterium RIFOXYB2_FULL_49_7]|nr:MAG: twitching motility protein PilT [Elusimicrobia bacterium RIFOXYB2_FULL_49_7]
MSDILVDSSVWIDYFNGTNSRANLLSDLIDNNIVCTNNIILAELIPSIKKAGESELADLFLSIKNIPINIDWDEIIKMQTINLKNGFNKIGIPDLIIMQNAIQNELSLFSFDKHFKSMPTFHKCKIFDK